MILHTLSSAATVFTILIGAAVIYYWHSAACRAVKQDKALSSEQWLILGVVFGFLGQVLDGSYWLVAWTVDFYYPSAPIRHWLFEYGIVANLPFRQTLGTLAAFFHIKASTCVDNDKTKAFKSFIYLAAILSTSFALMLFISDYYSDFNGWR